MSMKEFVTEWKSNPQLHTQLAKNPEAVCTKYGITGAQKETLISASKKGESELQKRITEFSMSVTK